MKSRWDGGLGYQNQNRLFSAILAVGWENIKHYILLEELDESEADIMESAFIYAWKTYWPSKGYNTRILKSDIYKSIEIPYFREIKPKQINDEYASPVEERYIYRKKHMGKIRPKLSKKVRLIETGQVFDSASEAANEMFVSVNSISRACCTKGASCGTCWISDDEEGWRMEVPAHWEYI